MWWIDGDDLAATAYAIADNRTAMFAEWDDTELAALLEVLREEDTIDGVGYSADDLYAPAELPMGQPDRSSKGLVRGGCSKCTSGVTGLV